MSVNLAEEWPISQGPVTHFCNTLKLEVLTVCQTTALIVAGEGSYMSL